jgi:anti-sigma factor RsiW
MECREVRELADSFLTEQLLVETNHEVVRHLEACPACRADLAARHNLRDRLRAAFAGAGELRPRADFTADLRAALQPAPAPVSRRDVLQWGALAAGVALAAGGTLFVRESRTRARLAALARDAAGDHQNCAVEFHLAERSIPLEQAGQRYGAPYAALAGFEFPTLDVPLAVVERHACVYDGRRFAHFVLRYEGALTSVLVTDGPSPDAPQIEPDASSPAVVSLPAGPFVGFVVADLDRARILHLARALTGPLSRRLA